MKKQYTKTEGQNMLLKSVLFSLFVRYAASTAKMQWSNRPVCILRCSFKMLSAICHNIGSSSGSVSVEISYLPLSWRTRFLEWAMDKVYCPLPTLSGYLHERTGPTRMNRTLRIEETTDCHKPRGKFIVNKRCRKFPEFSPEGFANLYHAYVYTRSIVTMA